MIVVNQLYFDEVFLVELHALASWFKRVGVIGMIMIELLCAQYLMLIMNIVLRVDVLVMRVVPSYPGFMGLFLHQYAASERVRLIDFHVVNINSFHKNKHSRLIFLFDI